jgi:exodeoxyribonuclease III
MRRRIARSDLPADARSAQNAAPVTRTVRTLNLNGIRSAGRRGFGRWLKRTRPDVLCAQEVRANESDVEDDLCSPEGWNVRWPCAVKKGYAGVGAYWRRAADRCVSGLPFEHCGDEGRALRADFHDLTVISLYVPSGSSSPLRQAAKFQFLEEIRPWFGALRQEMRPVLVCGDIDIAPTALDLARPQQNVKNSRLLSVRAVERRHAALGGEPISRRAELPTSDGTQSAGVLGGRAQGAPVAAPDRTRSAGRRRRSAGSRETSSAKTHASVRHAHTLDRARESRSKHDVLGLCAARAEGRHRRFS